MIRAVPIAVAIAGVLCSVAVAGGVSVKPCTRYEATVRARVASGLNVEEYPQFLDVVPVCVSRPTVLAEHFAAVQWRFADGSGKTIARPHEGASPQTLFSREWKTYRYCFWTPDNAAKVEFFPMNGAKGNRAEVELVEVREAPPSDGALNFNGDFSAADDAAWGWQLVGAACFQNIAPGRSVVSTFDGHLNGDLFPVKPGRRIRIEATCSDPVLLGDRYDSTNVRIAFYSTYAEASGKKQKKQMMDAPLVVKGRHATASCTCRVPDGRRWARISVWHGFAERITVTEDAL